MTAELLARTEADFVVVDLQHGAVAEVDLPGQTAALGAAGAVPLVRTRSPLFADVGRPLDLAAASSCPTSATPSMPGRSSLRRGTPLLVGVGRLSGGADRPLVITMIEPATALKDLDAVLAVEGLDGVYVGLGDLSLSLGLDGADRSAQLRSLLSSIIARAAAAGLPVGVHAYNGEDAAHYAAEGATIVTVVVDTISLGKVMARHLDFARSQARTDSH